MKDCPIDKFYFHNHKILDPECRKARTPLRSLAKQPSTAPAIKNMVQVSASNILAWAQDGIRAEKFDLKKETVPTYTEIVNSMNDFKKA